MRRIAQRIYDALSSSKEVLYDESSISFGEKLADTDLIGIPYQIIIKQKKIENALVELKNGKTDEIKEMSIEQVIARFM